VIWRKERRLRRCLSDLNVDKNRPILKVFHQKVKLFFKTTNLYICVKQFKNENEI
jgi:uncharacterized pyridoxamine 5'-phosphate oxidase family protein